MSNIANYNSASTTINPIGYAKISDNTQKIQKFVQYLHDFLPVIEKEFDDLESRNTKHPNEVFPIKMQALSDIYRAAQPLYEWYIQKAKKSA